jgi:CHAD domain-containing protein
LRTKKSGWAAIAPGIRRSYRDGRCAYNKARQSGKAEDFHEWRKRVKDLAYQVRILCRIWPQGIPSVEEKLQRLGDVLGDDHDLFMLTECEDMKRFIRRDPKAAQELKALVESRQHRLRSRALAIGASLYAEKPSEFCERLGHYWKEWRK